jgi:hypothetical protein
MSIQPKDGLRNLSEMGHLSKAKRTGFGTSGLQELVEAEEFADHSASPESTARAAQAAQAPKVS